VLKSKTRPLRNSELEKQHPEASKIEALRVSALALARQIDENLLFKRE